MKAESTEAGATNFTFDDDEELPGLVPVDDDSSSVSGTSGGSASGGNASASASGSGSSSVDGGSSAGASTSADDSNEVFSVKRVDKITTGVQDDGEEGEFY